MLSKENRTAKGAEQEKQVTNSPFCVILETIWLAKKLYK